MIENQRIIDLISYLKKEKIIRNQQDFVEKVGVNKATMSQIKTNSISVPNNMFGKINKAFPFVSIKWLRQGEGEMIDNSVVDKSEEVKMSREVFDQISRLTETVLSQQRTIENLSKRDVRVAKDAGVETA